MLKSEQVVEGIQVIRDGAAVPHVLERFQMWDVIPSLVVFVVGLAVIFLAVGENT